jgi:hypothetical protein
MKRMHCGMQPIGRTAPSKHFILWFVFLLPGWGFNAQLIGRQSLKWIHTELTFEPRKPTPQMPQMPQCKD